MNALSRIVLLLCWFVTRSYGEEFFWPGHGHFRLSPKGHFRELLVIDAPEYTGNARQFIDDLQQRDPILLIRLLLHTGDRSPVLAEIQRIPDWQFLIEKMLWEVHLCRYECSDFGRKALPEPIGSRLRGLEDCTQTRSNIMNAEEALFGILSGLAKQGSNDAVLLAAPYVFDQSRNKYDSDPIIWGTYQAAYPVFRSARSDLWKSPMVKADAIHDIARRWWLAHARKFHAEPPSSENASLEEALTLTKRAMREHLGVRFMPIFLGMDSSESAKRTQQYRKTETPSPANEAVFPANTPSAAPANEKAAPQALHQRPLTRAIAIGLIIAAIVLAAVRRLRKQL